MNRQCSSVNLPRIKSPVKTDGLFLPDQISAEKMKVSERLARLDANRARIATQLIDLEAAERVLARASDTSLVVVDPGHFHATLVQQRMYPGLSALVRVYAPLGAGLGGVRW
jgi:hypothetical protein